MVIFIVIVNFVVHVVVVVVVYFYVLICNFYQTLVIFASIDSYKENDG